MKRILFALFLYLLISGADAQQGRVVTARPDQRVVLGRDDRVTVSYAEIRNYRCAEGALVVREWGTRFRLTCDTRGGTITVQR